MTNKNGEMELVIQYEDGERREISYADGLSSKFVIKKEGISFYDSDIGLTKCLTWDKVKSFGINMIVGDSHKEYSKIYSIAYSDSNNKSDGITRSTL